MRKRDIQRMLRGDVLPHVPELTLFDTELIKTPVGRVLCCVSFNRSTDPLSFSHVYATAMPLWIPATSVWFPAGTVDLLVPGDDDVEPPPPRNEHYPRFGHVAKIRRRALPLFAELGAPELLHRNLHAHNRREAERRGYDYEPDAVTEEIMAGASVIVGDMDGAIASIQHWMEIGGKDDRDWALKKKAELSDFLARIRRGRREALDQLRAWEAITIKNLAIEPHMDPDRWDEVLH
jgi:hypothetical protein